MKQDDAAFKFTISKLNKFSNYENKSNRLKHAFDLSGELQLLQSLNNPERKFISVHVAGTVGKGSVCIALESMLRAAGYKTGLYTSPHIHNIRERIKINGRNISGSEFSATIASVIMDGNARPDRHTYFEVLTAAAFLCFAENNIDIAIVETGLGGRLDSTNALRSTLSVITRIGRDHTEVLGEKLEDIAREKAGIIKQSSRVVALKQSRIVNRVIKEKAEELESKISFADVKTRPLPRKCNRAEYTTEFFKENIAIALEAIEQLRELGFSIADGDVVSGLNAAKFPARLEKHLLKTKKGIIHFWIDAGHNPPAAASVSSEILKFREHAPGQTILVAGMMKDKDAELFLKKLSSAADIVICPEIKTGRALSAFKLSSIARKYFTVVKAAPNVKLALRDAVSLSDNNSLICLAGSFYMIDEGIQFLKTIKNSSAGY